MDAPDDSPEGGPEDRKSPGKTDATNDSADETATSGPDFFIVGIGASAGALEPISQLLQRLPREGNLAVVLVQHLDPTHHSILVELLARSASLPVQWASQDQVVQAGQIYVAPPNSCLSIKQGKLHLHEADRRRFGGDIDHFFSSLAKDAGHRAIAVMLSGNGTDGTTGAKAIKGAGGIVFAQEPSTASFPAMAWSAIDSGCVDHVLPPTGIADELFRFTEVAGSLWNRIGGARDASVSSSCEAEFVSAILRLLAARTGVDFGEYKPNTVKRRLARQMMLTKSAGPGEYLKLLQKHRDELDHLYQSLLIDVTEFFRDPEYFDFLQEVVFPQILARPPENVPIRIWVPGCATGEEVYSIAISLCEVMENKGVSASVQIFGTDVSERAIVTARTGLYSPSEVANIRPDRLRRYFQQTDRGFVVQKTLRDRCVFARQNVARDSPFSRLDLISCRNLLIYFSPKLQRKAVSMFHYALNPGGFLMLGNSESVGGQADMFRLLDRRFRIYSRKGTGRRSAPALVGPAASDPVFSTPSEVMAEHHKDSFDIIHEADRIVLSRHGPSGVLVNDNFDIVQFRGDVSGYLAPPPGRANLNLFRMAREGLGGELQAAAHEAREKVRRVFRTHVPVIHDGTTKAVNIDVTPISEAQSKERFFLILFSPADAAPPPEPKTAAPKGAKTGQEAEVDQLRQDLEATRTFLQAAIEKHESTNQELRAANEEIQSSNEELQSTNEELETAKEELQSSNEELTTVNEELHSRQVELIQLNNDLHNLINSVQVPIVILGHDMRIRRFTPMAEKILKVIPGDIGRPLGDINIGLTLQDLPQLVVEVTESLEPKEVEVQDRQGRWYSLRIRPYRTAENKIEGVVLTLVDVNTLKRALSEAEKARSLAEAVIETTREPLAVLTSDLKIERANEAFYQMFRVTKDRSEGLPLFDIVSHPEKLGSLKRALETVLPADTSLTNHEIGFDLPDTAQAPVTVNVRRVKTALQKYPLILLSIRPR